MSGNKEINPNEFGSNSWFVEYLSQQYQQHPEEISQQWQEFFDGPRQNTPNPYPPAVKVKPRAEIAVIPAQEDEVRLLAGSAAKILANMEASLSIPTATSQRIIPVKLLEENRILVNNTLATREALKISFTHIIAWAIVQAAIKYPVMNSAFTTSNEKPAVIKRKHINLGMAIDLEKKDGSRSLLVPNIKAADALSFRQFVEKYDDLVKRSRKGEITPDEFTGTTMTLTNPGTIGTVASHPRLMNGQGTIVAVGAVQYPPEYQAMAPETISNLGISKVLSVTSTYDHRIIQGAESGNFLKEIHELLLGGSGFYEQIFVDLGIPYRPFNWQADVHPHGLGGMPNLLETEKQARVLQLINMYRVRGHLNANLDPLHNKSLFHPELDPSFHGLTIWDFDRAFITGGFGNLRMASLRQILAKLKKTYCEKIGVEFMHIQKPEEKSWLQQQMEPTENTPNFTPEIKKRILKKLTEAEEFEHFIHSKFVGHKRFSLEGSETIIPVLDFLLYNAANSKIEEVVFGMAHRGRLNVLANIIGKSYDSIFSEFEEIIDTNSYQGSGDVKYHLGATGRYVTLDDKTIGVSIAPNPSHLEWVNPVVEGIVRAKQKRKGDTEHRSILPVLIHGDAAFAGQGVVAETLNLSQLKGYRTGGTVHIIINNQIGFTTTAEDARSSEYASDVAKMVQAPIFHVNGDDPEAALWTVFLALQYRQKFQKDVVIDVLGYRRHGHNEGDEPGFTQPLMYRTIKGHPSVLKIYREKLLKTGIISDTESEKISSEVLGRLSVALEKVKKKRTEFKFDIPLAVSKEKIKSFRPTEKTALSNEEINEIVLRLSSVPDTFSVHPKLQKFLEKRREFAADDGMADWALGESLAFASLLAEGIPVRLSGQDVVRGTFSHRHLALTDIETGEEYFPLNHMFKKQAQVEAVDSSLSEAAVLGFEYGYSTADPLSLVLWEAQFGDFANSAQVIIDNFIVASQEKWQTPSNLVMLLPHGFEGQGPEHSSARLERFLTLCAQDNIEVCNVSTPAQYFHLLRRHMKKGVRRPLIIMSPKSLLRLPAARSPKSEFINSEFRELLDDTTVLNREQVNRVLLTSGKVYYELLQYKKEHKRDDVALLRLEQYYPYDPKLIRTMLSSYGNADTLVWVQEEPRNMGAWNFLHWRLLEDKNEKQRLVYAGRPESASPAVGSSRIAAEQQKKLIEDAFSL